MDGCSPDEASQKAEKAPVNGSTLYATPEEELKDLYGLQGKGIFMELQGSKYGRVRSPFLLYFSCFLRIDYNQSLASKYLDLHTCVGKNTWCLCSPLISHPSLCAKRLPRTLFQHLRRNQRRNLPMWICLLLPRIHHS